MAGHFSSYTLREDLWRVCVCMCVCMCVCVCVIWWPVPRLNFGHREVRFHRVGLLLYIHIYESSVLYYCVLFLAKDATLALLQDRLSSVLLSVTSTLYIIASCDFSTPQTFVCCNFLPSLSRTPQTIGVTASQASPMANIF